MKIVFYILDRTNNVVSFIGKGISWLNIALTLGLGGEKYFCTIFMLFAIQPCSDIFELDFMSIMETVLASDGRQLFKNWKCNLPTLI